MDGAVVRGSHGDRGVKLVAQNTTRFTAPVITTVNAHLHKGHYGHRAAPASVMNETIERRMFVIGFVYYEATIVCCS
jgi:hypothetical protein